MVKPIFIIGRDRSGTKWLSNIIANHKDVACVQHKDHFGILEATDILGYAPIIFGDMRIPENFIAFLECFSQTDFFRITGLDKEHFYRVRPDNYFSFFREMMDRFAENNCNSYWVQKSDIISMGDLSIHYPEGKFVIIIRDMKDNLRSKIGQRVREGINPQKYLVRGAIRYFTDNALVKKYSDQDNVCVVQYEHLIQDKSTTVKNICKFLHIEFDEKMLEDKFRKNTSFNNGVSRDKVFTQMDLIKIAVISILLGALPAWVYDYLYLKRKKKIKNELLTFHERKFISFKLRKKELGWK